MWIEVISASVAGCSGVLAMIGALAAHRHAAAARVASSADRGTQSLKSQVSGLAERIDALEELLQRIDARDRMRKVRAGRAEEPGTNPYTDPDGWKQRMRAAKAAGGK